MMNIIIIIIYLYIFATTDYYIIINTPCLYNGSGEVITYLHVTTLAPAFNQCRNAAIIMHI